MKDGLRIKELKPETTLTVLNEVVITLVLLLLLISNVLRDGNSLFGEFVWVNCNYLDKNQCDFLFI